MLTLYQLTSELTSLYEAISECDSDEPDAALLDTAEMVEMDFTQKLEGYVKIITSIEAEADAFATEAKRLSERAKSLLKRKDWLKKRMADAMKAAGKNNVKGKHFKIRLWQTPGRAVVDDEDQLPDKYVKLVKKPVQTELTKALRQGVEIPGAHLLQEDTVRYR